METLPKLIQGLNSAWTGKFLGFISRAEFNFNVEVNFLEF